MTERKPKNCLDNCPDFSIKDGKPNCARPYGGCLTCLGHDPASGCWIEKLDAMANSPEQLAKEAKEKAENEAWLNRPKIKLVCKKCAYSRILGQEEYTDKRRRRKYEPESWCERCNDFTEHEWKEALP
jgi:hypothetical protein